jgi:selenide,water dikinase
MAPGALAQVLRSLQGKFPPERFPDLLVGLAVSDDAAVYRISDEVAVIQTLDFFPPVVDDPYDYGAIAAANAMSDIYAMGGEVTLALNISTFPPDLSPAILAEILRGGADKVAEAGGVIAGGHTVEDKEPKYGLSVMGLIHPDQVLTKASAQPGDVLLLTKPLGVGIITTVLKAEIADPAHVAPAIASMKRLNRQASQLIQDARASGAVHGVQKNMRGVQKVVHGVQKVVHACTDITGFALLGHSYEMAEKSGVRLRFQLHKLPFLEGARAYADQWLFPAGTCNNENAYRHGVTFDPGIDEETQQLLYTPETSGGLLVAIAPQAVETVVALFEEAGHPCWVVGEVVEGAGVHVAA